MSTNSTITACATPPGRGGIGVVRVSGLLAPTIATAIIGKTLEPRYAAYCNFLGADQEIIDRGIALYFKAPDSFTGEDVLELHCHGGPIIIDRLLGRIVGLGARMARPGEFSERAFLNGKIDLTQAEAIADLIDASSITAAQNAARTLRGEFSRYIYELVEGIINLRAPIEVAIDFEAEEEHKGFEVAIIRESLARILKKIQQVKNAAKQGVLLRDGITIVIAGKPNVGKSSLLNRFTGEDTAIVTHLPGTTRDVLRSHIQIDGIPLHILDTAGLHESDNLIEQEGIKRAWNEIKKADHVLLVVDAAKENARDPNQLWSEFFAELPEHAQFTVVYNKIDLTKEEAKVATVNDINCVYLSAKTAAGMDLLKTHLKNSIGLSATPESGFSARRRHLEALNQAEKHIMQAQESLFNATYELLAEDLRQAQKALDEITGEFTTEDLLDRIFSEFCVGK